MSTLALIKYKMLRIVTAFTTLGVVVNTWQVLIVLIIGVKYLWSNFRGKGFGLMTFTILTSRLLWRNSKFILLNIIEVVFSAVSHSWHRSILFWLFTTYLWVLQDKFEFRYCVLTRYSLYLLRILNNFYLFILINYFIVGFGADSDLNPLNPKVVLLYLWIV